MNTYEIFPEKKIVIMVYWGKVNFQEIIETNEKLANDPRFDKSFNGVVDHRKTESQLSSEEVEQIAKRASDNDISIGKWVILVKSPKETALSYRYKRKIQEQHPQNVCSTIKGASEFLGFDLRGYLEAGPDD